MPSGVLDQVAQRWLAPIGEVAWTVEFGRAPLLAITLFQVHGEDATEADRFPGALQSVAKLVTAQVQKHGVGEHRVVRAAEVVAADIEQSGAVPRRAKPVDERGVASLRVTRTPRCSR